MEKINPNKSSKPGALQIPFQEEAIIFSKECVKSVLGEALGQNHFSDRLWTAYKKMSIKKNEIDFLPLVLYETVSPNIARAAPLMAAWQLMRCAAKCFDDAEDDGDQPAQLINMGTAFLFASQKALGKLEGPTTEKEIVLTIIKRYNQAGLSACAGQFQDLSGQTNQINVDPDTWMEIALSKSGDLFAWAAWAGVFLAGVEERSWEAYASFGRYLGALVQANDDFESVWGSHGTGDLESFPVSLPYVYALHVTPPEKRDVFLKLIKDAKIDKAVKKQIQENLITIGAQKFMLAVMVDLRNKAMDALNQTGHSASGRLNLVIDLLNRLCPPLVRQ